MFKLIFDYVINQINTVVPAKYGTYFFGVAGLLAGIAFTVLGDFEFAATLIILSLQVIRQRKSVADLEAAVLGKLEGKPVVVAEPNFPSDKYQGAGNEST